MTNDSNLAAAITRFRELDKKRTQGGFKARYFPETENINGTLVQTKNYKRMIFVERNDEQGRRLTQIIADILEQAAHQKEGEVNADFFASAPEMMQTIYQLLAVIRQCHAALLGSLNQPETAASYDNMLNRIQLALQLTAPLVECGEEG